jgi:hypothetical protein
LFAELIQNGGQLETQRLVHVPRPKPHHASRHAHLITTCQDSVLKLRHLPSLMAHERTISFFTNTTPGPMTATMIQELVFDVHLLGGVAHDFHKDARLDSVVWLVGY